MNYVIDLNWNESIALLHNGEYVYIKYRGGSSGFTRWKILKSRFDKAWESKDSKLALFGFENEKFKYVLNYLFSYKIYPDYHKGAENIVFSW